MFHFNPRTHVGCDLVAAAAEIPDAVIFQSTHPRGVRRQLCFNIFFNHEFQSTHPRGVRLNRLVQRVTVGKISIHAPTWGATCPAIGDGLRECISIHAPTWGATARCRCLSITGNDFNPRTHVGCDL